MFTRDRILYEDNHLLVVNKLSGELVQPDQDGESALENEIKDFIKKRDSKPGAVFLGVVHRIDRPVSGAVMFAKTSKALARLNEMVRSRTVEKRYWAIVEDLPDPAEGELRHYISRDGRTNRAHIYLAMRKRPGLHTSTLHRAATSTCWRWTCKPAATIRYAHSCPGSARPYAGT